MRPSVRTVVAAAAVLVGIVGVAPATSSGSSGQAGRSTTSGRQAAVTLAPQVLASTSLALPYGVAVTADGDVYAADTPTGRILVQHPDGTSAVVVSGLTAPKGLAVAADGTIYVGDGSKVLRIAPDGTQTDLGVAGVEDVSALALGADGTLYLTDPPTGQVLKIAPGGTAVAVGFTGVDHPKGVAVDASDTVYVVDTDTADVISRTTGGTQAALGFTGLVSPESVAVQGDRVAVSQPGGVVLLDGGTQSTPAGLALEIPGGIAMAADGAIYAAANPDGLCSCPEGPGVVRHLPASGPATTLTFGDIASFGAVAAAQPGTVLFTSFTGPRGYSDQNPLRRIVDAGAPADVATGSATGELIDAAPDGTIYRATDHGVTSVAPDGTVTAIPVTTAPGLDAVTGISVDETGRLFVALTSGYGPGGFRIVEPLAAGGQQTAYEDLDNAASLDGMAAGGGVLLVSATNVGGNSHHLLLQVAADGTATTRTDLGTNPVDSVEADADATAYLLRPANSTVGIAVVTADGTTTSLAYVGMTTPRSLSMATDGTLYVADDAIGVLALAEVGPTEGDVPVMPIDPIPAPAVPIPGSASYTG